MNKTTLATLGGLIALSFAKKQGQQNTDRKTKDWNTIFKNFETFLSYLEPITKNIKQFNELIIYPGFDNTPKNPEDDMYVFELEIIYNSQKEYIQAMKYWYGVLRGFFELNEMTLYRSVDIVDIEDIKMRMSELGDAWTWSLDTAKAICFGEHQVDDEGFEEKCGIIEATVKTSDIDWSTTLNALFLFSINRHEDNTTHWQRENEIKMNSGSKVFVKNVYLLSNHHENTLNSFAQYITYDDYETVPINSMGTT